MSDYPKTTWVDDVTPMSAANMNKIETGIDDAHTEIENHVSTMVDHVGSKIYLYKNIGGAL